MSRVIIEVSHSFQSGYSTGIQRVVYETIQELKRQNKRYTLVWLPYGSCNGYYDVSTVFFEQKGFALSKSNDLIKRFRLGESRIIKTIMSFLRRSFLVRRFVANLTLLSMKKHGIEKFKIVPGDQIFLLDAFWTDGAIVSELLRLSQKNVKINLFVHDIFPLSNPEWFDAFSVKLFTRNFLRVLQAADAISTSSLTNRSALEEYMRVNNIRPMAKDVSIIPLGTNHLDFAGTPPTDRNMSGLVWIGTIEPRKNISFLLDLLETENVNFEVLIFGRPGWKSAKQIAKLEELSFNKSLRWYKNASDFELLELSAKHKVGVVTSINEGFGFVLYEMLAMGFNVVAPRIHVYEQVRSNNLFFFELSDISSFSNAIKKACAHEHSTENLTKFPTWECFVNQLVVRVV